MPLHIFTPERLAPKFVTYTSTIQTCLNSFSKKKHITKDSSNPGSIGASHEKRRSTTLQHFLQHPSYHLITQSTTQRHNLQRISTNLNYTWFLAKLATNCNLLPPRCSMTTGFFSRTPPSPKKRFFKILVSIDSVPDTSWCWHWNLLHGELTPPNNKKETRRNSKGWNFRNHGKMVLNHILNI